MSLPLILLIANGCFFIGYAAGRHQGFVKGSQEGAADGFRRGAQEGFAKGIKAALEELDKAMRGGLTSALDWETAQRLLRERMGRN